MAYTKYSLTPANNNAAPPDGAPEGMLPSAVNDTMRDMMAQIRDVGDGIRGGTYTMTAPVITGGSISGLSSLASTGVATFSAGSASAPAITATGDTNTGIFFPAADTIAFTEGGVESMRIDASGNVGIGVVPFANTLSSGLDLKNGAGLFGFSNNSYLSNNLYYDSAWKYKGTGFGTVVVGNSADGAIQFNGTSVSGSASGSATLSERMRIDSAGNVGIGSNNPAGRLTVTASGGAGVSIGQSNENFYAASLHRFYDLSYANERMRIDSSGNLLVGTTSAGDVNLNNMNFFKPDGSLYIGHVSGTASGKIYAGFGLAGSSIGSITQNGTTGVLYNLTSDYRLKNNATPLTGASEFIMALQPKSWDWWDGSGKGVGFIAHEFMEVAKYSGNGEKDAVDSEGKPVYQSIQPSSSEVMANLVALVQELKATVDAQAARIAALESN